MKLLFLARCGHFVAGEGHADRGHGFMYTAIFEYERYSVEGECDHLRLAAKWEQERLPKK